MMGTISLSQAASSGDFCSILLVTLLRLIDTSNAAVFMNTIQPIQIGTVNKFKRPSATAAKRKPAVSP